MTRHGMAYRPSAGSSPTAPWLTALRAELACCRRMGAPTLRQPQERIAPPVLGLWTRGEETTVTMHGRGDNPTPEEPDSKSHVSDAV